MQFGFYIQVPAKHILPVAKPDPEVLAMLTSGLTASIALEKVSISVLLFLEESFYPVSVAAGEGTYNVYTIL